MKLLIQNKANHSTIFDEWNEIKRNVAASF